MMLVSSTKILRDKEDQETPRRKKENKEQKERELWDKDFKG
jgi:hypothetical protein